MDAIQFAYWLRGYLELTSADGKTPVLTEEQVKMINEHLDLVMKPVTPLGLIQQYNNPSVWTRQVCATTSDCDTPTNLYCATG